MRRIPVFRGFLLVAALATTAACGSGDAKKADAAATGDFKVALLTPGPISDKSWNGGAYAGLTEMRFLSLVWDGRILHTTQPVESSLPVQLHKRIQLLHIGEFDFNPVFEMISESGETGETIRFQPEFQQGA